MKIIIENKKTKEIVFEKVINGLDRVEAYSDSIEIAFSFEGVEASFDIDLKENNFKIE